jgi:hypothetical protein
MTQASKFHCHRQPGQIITIPFWAGPVVMHCVFHVHLKQQQWWVVVV